MNIVTRNPTRSGVILLFIFVILSVFFIYEYAKKERLRDLKDWQVRLSILSDMRTSSVEEWLRDRKNKVDDLANNPTLQLYLSQHKQFDRNDIDMQAQLAHVKNLLRATSLRFGFADKNRGAKNILNIEDGGQGLAVISRKGDMLFSTVNFYKYTDTHEKLIREVIEAGGISLIDVFKVGDQKTLYGYIQPVFPIQKIKNQKAVGAILVLMDPARNLYTHLNNDHVSTTTDESLLIRKSGLDVEYISPLRAGLSIMHKMPLNMMEGVFNKDSELVSRQDYSNTEVLSVSRRIEGTPWTLIQKINTNEALQESDEHQKYLFVTFILISLLLASMFVAVWRHSTSVRLQKITKDLESRTALLDAVSDNINEHIFLVDENMRFIFINISLASSLKNSVHDVCGKSMASVLGKEVSAKLQKLNCELNDAVSECVISLELGEKENVYHVSTVILQKGEYKNAKLYVLHEITAIKSAQEKRDRLSQGIISTLVKAVDLHDPYCVDHSTRTREVALGIAHELKLESDRCEALEMASLLANIGKLFVSKEILTKMDPLTEKESQILRENIKYAVDVLKELEFEGPVIEIISQKNESLDGSGYPLGLKAADIMLEAKILAASNAFVAMASSRAYRKGKSIKEVVNMLLEQTDIHYDRHVVAALFHISENRNDWDKWQNVTK